MRLRKIMVLALALLMVASAFSFASCGKKGEGDYEEIKIGLTAPLSGVGAGYGEDVKDGIDMAVSDINAEGGITIGDTEYKFKLVAADDEANPESALANAQRFVLEEGVDIVFCPYTSCIIPLLGINTKVGEEFLLMTYTSIPLYTNYPNPYMITMPPPFYMNFTDYIRMAMGKGWKKMGMLQTTEQYGVIYGDAFEKAWTGAGGTVVAKAPASYYTESDFTPYLTTVLAQNPDVIFAGGPSYPTGLVIEQARGLGFKGGFILMDQSKMDDIAENFGLGIMEGVIGVLPVELSTFAFIEPFVQKYMDKYGSRATWETCINYTGTWILARAMERAGSVDDVDAIMKAFNTEDVPNTVDDPQVPVEYGGILPQTGQLIMPTQTCIVQNGKYVEQPLNEWWTKL